MNVSEQGKTNQYAELRAIHEALITLRNRNYHGNVRINTDSQ